MKGDSPLCGSAIALCCRKGNSGGRCHASSNRPPLSKRLNPLALDSLLKKSREPRDFLNRLLRLPGALVERSGRIHSDGGNQPREQDARKSKQRFFSGDRNPGPELFPATGTRGHGGCGESGRGADRRWPTLTGGGRMLLSQSLNVGTATLQSYSRLTIRPRFRTDGPE